MKSTIDVWTDSTNRARRIHTVMTITIPARPADPGVSTGTTFTIPASTQTLDGTTEFFDFGTRVEVQAPSVGQVYDQTDSFLAQMRGPGTVAAQSWHVAARGTLSSGPWTVYAAKTSTGWSCYDAPGTQRGTIDAITTSNGFPKHGADTSECSVPGSAASLGIFNAFVNTTDGGRRIIVGVTTAAGAATITLADGTSRPLTVDPETSLVNWSQPSTGASPLRLIVDGISCRLDGLGNALGDSGAPAPTGTKVSPNDVPCAGANPNFPLIRPGSLQTAP